MILTEFFSGDHSGPSLANNFLSILKRYSLDDAVIYITANNASVNQQVAQEIEKQCIKFTSSTNTIGCMAHVRHLAACDGLRSLADGPTSATTPEYQDLPAPILIPSLATPLMAYKLITTQTFHKLLDWAHTYGMFLKGEKSLKQHSS
ncbi:hypothetical protein O181_028399 [Austropuccinia psidii MF-1]|uniref:Uncharacterized protein n=1 Tax=Austropuccinia psidii MF-1 TaxID=1389203 RepID=A0A9Q3CNU1_9BASI|nr:hypothetical protein [Austropuccinia psidii MF-1]